MASFLRIGSRAIRMAGMALVPAIALAQTPLPDPCDVNKDGSLTEADKTVAVSMSIGQVQCASSILANGACNAAMVQRVVNAVLGGGCRTDTYHPHAVTLTWVASPTAGVSYSVYRSETAGGPYSLVKSNVKILSFFDPNVVAGRTYYYVVSAVDTSGNASVYSNQAVASVPTP